MRTILHVDMNNFYASVECLYRPEIRHLPVAVAGDPLNRHGIILAKNMIAKKLGIKTGEAIWEAKLKAPNLVTVPPDFSKYLKFSRLARQILSKCRKLQTKVHFFLSFHGFCLFQSAQPHLPAYRL